MSILVTPITVSTVYQLLGDVLRHGVFDESDVKIAVRPFMAAIFRDGVPRDDDDVAPALVETFRQARAAVDRMLNERELGVRSPQRNPPTDDDARDCYDIEALRAFWRGAQ